MATELDRHFMSLALAQAERAMAEQEVPVGALVVVNEEVVGVGWNRPISACDPTAHAEIQALRSAAQKQNNYRLPKATLYVTIEPCAMCVGAMIHARIDRLVYGAPEPKAGAVSSRLQLLELPHWNHQLAVEGGVLDDQAGALMQSFFKQRRAQQKAQKKGL